MADRHGVFDKKWGDGAQNRCFVSIYGPGVIKIDGRPWACDDFKSDGGITKTYFSESEDVMFAKIKDMPPSQLNFYEMIVSPNTPGIPPQHLPTHIYMDLDAKYSDMTEDERKNFPSVKDMTKIVIKNISQFVRKKLQLDDKFKIRTAILDSSSDVKYSVHLIMRMTSPDGRPAVMANNAHVGAIFRHWLDEQDRVFPFFVAGESVIDIGVYSQNRQMRLPGSGKLGSTPPRLLYGIKMPWEKMTLEETLANAHNYIIQSHDPELLKEDNRLILKTTEIDGSEPGFTSKDFETLNRKRLHMSSSSSSGMKRPRTSGGGKLMLAPAGNIPKYQPGTMYLPSQTMWRENTESDAYRAKWDSFTAGEDFAESMTRAMEALDPSLHGLSLRELLTQWVCDLTGDEPKFRFFSESKFTLACERTKICHLSSRVHTNQHVGIDFDLTNASVKLSCFGTKRKECTSNMGITIKPPDIILYHMFVATTLAEFSDTL
jgi:hypothetical protein